MNDYYLLATLDDEEERTYVYHKVSEIILASQIFFIVYTLLFFFMSIESSSNYYWIFYSIIPGVHLYSTCLVLMKKGTWSTQDIRALLMFNMSDIFSPITAPSKNFRPFTTWMGFKILLFIYSICVGLKPWNQYSDLVGPPTNSSSCTTEYLSPTGNPYNPMGYFNKNMNYTSQIMLNFCPMNQTWAYPNYYSYIVGYSQSPLGPVGVSACSNPLPPFTTTPMNTKVHGYADAHICINPNNGTSKSYLSPVLGINAPLTAGSLNSQMVLCKGNTEVNICISPNGDYAYEGTCPTLYRIGKPKMICSSCLNYWRSLSGDYTGPPGYGECSPYDSTAYNNPFCAFCPGRGYGFFATEKYDESHLNLNRIIAAIITCLLIVEYGICLCLIQRYIPDLTDTNQHKYKIKINEDEPEEETTEVAEEIPMIPSKDVRVISRNEPFEEIEGDEINIDIQKIKKITFKLDKKY